MTNDSPAVAIGALIDERHRIEGFLGSGGFATVYLGRDIETGRSVAIKVLNGTHRPSERALARFQREVDAVRELQCPSTVRLHATGEAADGTPFIVFEHVPGEDASKVLAERGPLDPAVVRHIITQVLESLKEAHEVGVLHRDIKPDNIRIYERDGDPWAVKVLDFGIARMVDPQDARLTKTGELLGTPRYMSPEQLLSQPLGPASDIYSVGILALELMLGSDALHGHRLSDQLNRLQTGHMFAPTADNERFQSVVTRMTARAIEDRFQSVESVLRALNPPAAPSPPADSHASSTAVSGVGRGPVAVTTARTNVENEAPEASFDVRLVVAFVAGALIMALGGAAFLTTRDGDEAAEPVQVPTALLRSTTAKVNPLGAEAQERERQSAPKIEPVVEQSGCGAQAKEGESVLAAKVRGDIVDLERAFKVYVPKGYDPSVEHPVVLMFQTVIFNPESLFDSARIRELADREQIIVLGFYREGPAFLDSDHEYIRGALDGTKRTFCVDPDRIFALGHGRSGPFARAVACENGFRAVATFADFSPTALGECSAPIAHLRISAVNDPFSPFEGGYNCVGDGPAVSAAEAEAGWRELNGCDEKRSRRVRDKGGECRVWECTHARFASCHIEGNHTWPNEPLEIPTLPGCESRGKTTFPIRDVAWKFFTETL